MFARPTSSPPEVGKPDLELVLTHYGVRIHGKKFMASCTHHQDNKPSLSVDLNKGLWKCQSCGRGGDSWTFIQEQERTDYRGAVEYAARASLSAEAAGVGEVDERRSGSYYTGGSKLAHGKRVGQERRSFRPSWSRAE